MQWFTRHLHRLLDEFARIEVVVKRAAGNFGQLPIMSVGKDRKKLPAWRQVCSQASSCKRIGDWVGSEARDTLLAVRDDGRSSRFESFDCIGNRVVLLRLKLSLSDLLGVVVGVSLLQL